MTTSNAKHYKKYMPIALVILLIAVAIGAVFSLPAARVDAEFSGGALKSVYIVGETLQVPDATFTVDGKSVKAESVVYFPDGNGYRTNSIAIEQMGVHTVLYRAEVNGTLYTEEVTVFAEQSLYTVTSKASSASYGKDESAYDTGLTGIRLSLAEKDSFTFNKIVDVNKCNASNPVLKFYALPTVRGQVDARYVYIDMIDIYDPENVVSVMVKASAGTGTTVADMAWQYTYAYVMAKAPGQIYTGLEGNKVHRGNIYGMPCNFSLYGMGLDLDTDSYGTGKGDVDRQFFGVYMNGSAVCSTNVYGGGTIVDVNNSDYQPTGWNGFTTGEVYVKVYTGANSAATCNYIITDIGGVELSDDYVNDNEGPAITIDTQGLDIDNLPEGAKGYSYPVFPATANDLYSGDVKVSARAFYNYYSSTRYELDTRGGRFDTDVVGAYSIVYTAVDRVGNETKIVLPVTVKDGAAPLTITTESNPIKKDRAGNVVPLAKITGYSGGNGIAKPGYEVKLNGQAVKLYTQDSFIPESTGTYSVSAYVEDTVGQRKAFDYSIEIESNPSPSIIDDVKLPDYILEGLNYMLPELYAVDYTNNKAQVATTISVTDGSGTRDCPAGAPVSFVADKDGYAIIKYTSGVNSKEYKVPVIKVKDESGYKMENYFLSDVGTSSAIDGQVILTTEKSDASFRYAKEMLVDNFAIRYYVGGFDLNKRFTELSFVLTDYLDPSVKLTLTQKNNSAYLYVNGVQTLIRLGGTFANGLYNTLTYDDLELIISDGTGNMVSVNTAGFAGFPSHRVVLDIELTGVTGKSAIGISRINQQLLGTVRVDNIAPELKILGEYGLAVSKGKEITVLKALAVDMLDPDLYSKVSVTYDGEYVTSKNNILLRDADVGREYIFVADKFGEYIIAYESVDSSGKRVARSFKVQVIDDVPPVIKLNGSVPETLKLGKSKKLPDATVTDNLSKDLKVTITVTSPDGKIRACKDKNFTATMRGTYKVKYFAIDDEGNTTVLSYDIVVS